MRYNEHMKPIEMRPSGKFAVLLFGMLAAAIFYCAATPSPALAQGPGAMLVGVEKVHSVPMTQTVPIVGRLVSLRMGDISARIAGPVEEG